MTSDSSLFTSRRERRLWIWTAVVLVAIYSTLFLASTLSSLVENQRMLDQLFFNAFVVTLWAIAGSTIRWKPGWRELWVMVAVGAVYFGALLRTASAAHRSHIFEYTVLTILIYQALLERRRNGRKVPVPAVTALMLSVLVGVVDEGLQFFIPSRVFDPVDIGVNSVFALMAIVACVALAAAGRATLRARDRLFDVKP